MGALAESALALLAARGCRTGFARNPVERDKRCFRRNGLAVWAACLLQPIALVRFSVWHLCHRLLEPLTVAASSSILQVDDGLPSSNLLCQGRRHQLVERNIFLLGHFLSLLHQRIRQFYIHSRHGISPSLRKKSGGVSTEIPKLSAPR